MIDDPDRWAPGYAEAGAFSVTFHAEAAADAVALARRLRDIGARAGIAVKPDTPIEPYLELLAEFDQVLVMTVEPGFGGQAFLASTMPKLHLLRQAVADRGLDVWLQVDGGVDERTIAIAADAGADTFVAGSSVFASRSGGDGGNARAARSRNPLAAIRARVTSASDSDRRMSEFNKTKPEIEFYDGAAPEDLVTTDLDRRRRRTGDPGLDGRCALRRGGPGIRRRVRLLVEPRASINFPLANLIAGWQQGIPGMRVGGRRQLIVPPHLAYGAAGSGHQLSGRTLIFVIDLLGVS